MQLQKLITRLERIETRRTNTPAISAKDAAFLLTSCRRLVDHIKGRKRPVFHSPTIEEFRGTRPFMSGPSIGEPGEFIIVGPPIEFEE